MTWSRVLKSRLRDRVLVTTKDGPTFDGVLFEADGNVLVLREASAVAAGENKTNLPLDGEIVLMMWDVAYIQRP